MLESSDGRVLYDHTDKSNTIKNCSSCNNPIDPIHGAPLAKEVGPKQFQCLHCQNKEIKNIRMRLEGPQSDYTKQVLYKRIREMEGKLKEDEINHIRKQNRIKITAKSPKRFQKKQQQQPAQKGQPQNQNQKQPTSQQPKKKMRLVVKKRSQQQPHTFGRGWASLR
ncbi:MAG: hypothetical protein M3146_08615 [Thermoproteota archaeon]|nr:hypothetical protein [Thermoproteota archaeon]